jgi:hypothetical protein
MGKKYDTYVEAVKANNSAKADAVTAQGGSTRDKTIQTQTNAQQAQMVEDWAWERVVEDPNG